MKAKLSDESLVVVNEALNGMFDVFGEDEAAPFCSQLQLGSTLQQFLPQFKKRVRQGHAEEELRAMLEESLENVEGFIEYLRSLK